MEYHTISLTHDGAVVRLTLLQTALGARFLREFDDALALLAGDDGARVLLVAAFGDDFATGWADDAVEALARPAAALDASAVDAFGRLAALPLPALAALKGRVASAGLELALACDIRVAAADARFAMPETAQGRLPLAGGGQRLARIAGRGAAMAMLLAGEELDAAAALRCGLVSRVINPSQLDSEAARLAQTIASRGPLGVRMAKEAVLGGLDLTLEQGLRYELDLSVLLQTTRDREEGVRAFLEKRKPDFEGR